MRALMQSMEKIRCYLIFYLNIRKSHLGINSQCHLYKTILIWHNIILSVIHLLVPWTMKEKQQFFKHNNPHIFLINIDIEIKKWNSALCQQDFRYFREQGGVFTITLIILGYLKTIPLKKCKCIFARNLPEKPLW